MNWYYITITFLPEHRNNEAIAAKCIRILHGFSYRHETRGIGVSFPLWDQTTVGSKLTFVSTNQDELNTLVTQKYFKDMVELGYFNISELNVVPADCTYALFKRKQSIDKSTTGGQIRKLRRLEKRAKARGEAFDVSTKINQHETNTVHHYHSLEEVSSTGNEFRLNIQMEPIESLVGEGSFSSYGLGNGGNSVQSVPLI